MSLREIDLVITAAAPYLEAQKRDAWEQTLLLVYAWTGESISYDEIMAGPDEATNVLRQAEWMAFNQRAQVFAATRAEA